MSKSDENYTPDWFVTPCREFLGGFDLDPFSCLKANEVIKAKLFFTKEGDAFSQDWTRYKRKWVNPPYSRSLIAKTLGVSSVGETLLLVNSSTSARWFHDCMRASSAYLHPFRRIQFDSPYREGRSSNEYDQTLFYFGDRPLQFAKALTDLGDSVRPIK